MNQATSTNCIFAITNFTFVKDKVLNWANRFSTFCFLDNNQYNIPPHSAECILAAGAVKFIEAAAGDALKQMQQFIGGDKRWLFGHLGYDLKNEIEAVQSSHTDRIGFPDLFFFQPEILIQFDRNKMTIQSEREDEEKIFNEILAADDSCSAASLSVNIHNKITQEEYISIIEKLKQHIVRGDCYEINFCQEFFAENIAVSPLQLFKKLSAISPNPFSAFYRMGDRYLLCASPERFLKKEGNRILSQPIKGTSQRMTDEFGDKKSKSELMRSAKDRSENVMIVDLVRNDLSKICVEGTVKADELYGIYSYPLVHQMISTISGRLKEDISFSEIINATFPMGSMTGAPKKKVMELIEKYEKTKRGIFSGALGYLNPEGDFDFNVVIRSIMYDVSNKYLSFQAGSGITFYSNPEKEWEECLLKARAIRKALKN